MLVGEKDMSEGSKGKHKGQSDKCCDKVIYKVLWDKTREQVLQTDWGKFHGSAAAGRGSGK